MAHDLPSFEEFKRVCMGKRKKAIGPNGVPHRLLGMLPDDALHTLYEGMLEVWRTGDIPQHWPQSEVVLMYKKGDPTARKLSTHRRDQQHITCYTKVVPAPSALACSLGLGLCTPRLSKLQT